MASDSLHAPNYTLFVSAITEEAFSEQGAQC